MHMVMSCRYTRNKRRVEPLAVNTVHAASRCYCRHAISLRISQPVRPILSSAIYLL